MVQGWTPNHPTTPEYERLAVRYTSAAPCIAGLQGKLSHAARHRKLADHCLLTQHSAARRRSHHAVCGLGAARSGQEMGFGRLHFAYQSEEKVYDTPSIAYTSGHGVGEINM